jgi:hypothetical protein
MMRRMMLSVALLTLAGMPGGLRAQNANGDVVSSGVTGFVTAVDLQARSFTLVVPPPPQPPTPPADGGPNDGRGKAQPAASSFVISVNDQTVIIHRNSRRATLEDLAQLAARRRVPAEVILVDNAAPLTDGVNVASRVVVGGRPPKPPKPPKKPKRPPAPPANPDQPAPDQPAPDRPAPQPAPSPQP